MPLTRAYSPPKAAANVINNNISSSPTAIQCHYQNNKYNDNPDDSSRPTWNLEKELQAKNKQLLNSHQMIENSKEKVSCLQLQLAAAKKNRREFEQDVKRLKDKNSQLIFENKESETKIADMQELLNSKSTQVGELESLVSNLVTSKNQIEQDLAELKCQLENENTSIKEINKDLQQQTMEQQNELKQLTLLYEQEKEAKLYTEKTVKLSLSS
ncbi:hypothetical protein EB796_012254 [Bugula neritina]|uniref:Uncharacterized protein n=1 Tax=Bugula neritina TaxID=10212 RepID=A0A7J7JUR7_BUGNE|nr:hypothetical protein EB796_012254 [Bugula neritina]